MIQILHFIDGKMCFVKEHGIYFDQPAGKLLFLSFEVISLKKRCRSRRDVAQEEMSLKKRCRSRRDVAQEEMSLNSNNADLTGVQNTTKWYVYSIKSVYWIISEVSRDN